ncbi:MAG: hypothetical protein K1X31_03985 [Gemmatimonadaceae bacterium]|nr:hypothetical protein [Gemmatimonadaceae bacterium]
MNSSDTSRNCALRTLAASRSDHGGIGPRRTLHALVGLLAVPAVLAAQDARSIEGQVTLPGATAAGRPAAGAMMTLHRVGPDAAGPIDSMRTGTDGRYRFRYRATGDTSAVYFVSTVRGGVNYFTPPMREPTVRGGMADLVVYDTTSAPVPIAVRGRHLIITVPDSGTRSKRTVIEAFELSNDSSVTRVARGAAGTTFEAALPPGIGAPQPGQGDVSPDAIAFAEGRMKVTAPLAPGLKQVSISYEIPADVDPFEVLIEQPVTVLEVLVEDPSAVVTGAGLVPEDPVSIEGRPFRRFVAQDAAAAQTVRVTIPPAATSRSLRVMLIVTAVGAAMLLGLGMVMMRRGPHLARRRDDDPDSLALEVAALDAAFERVGAPTEAERAEHYLKRAQLKGRLAAALAKRDGLA